MDNNVNGRKGGDNQKLQADYANAMKQTEPSLDFWSNFFWDYFNQ